ncbi:MAG: metal-dependent transcriptional regulator [Methanospirillum sp.]|uniref:metal-dependent transcriptional regulator n=1 Tax=Methanospirillum sp. TaxID=45200 RepID=UPI00237411C7|nr:metal-dependent transcriptional regulator [Methanospirillum sp.]MDD1729813.1 metal-dependent transcriptional regulator [Methanospirillum sp.]
MADEKRSKRHEDLLEAIYEVSQEKGYAKSRDIAAALCITPATVTDGFKRLSDAGLVNYEPYGGVTLTEAGFSIARQTQDSHHIIRRLLELSGVDPVVADRDACVMEHGLSPDSCTHLSRVVSFIETCLEDETCNQRFLTAIEGGKEKTPKVRAKK